MAPVENVSYFTRFPWRSFSDFYMAKISHLLFTNIRITIPHSSRFDLDAFAAFSLAFKLPTLPGSSGKVHTLPAAVNI
tara:strand:- start:914 stop:1147 length:234 start_codon:yes stop_codon:yes gene_type:complete